MNNTVGQWLFESRAWITRLVADHLPRRSVFNSELLHVKFVLVRVALRKVSVVLRYSPANNIPPALLSDPHLHRTLNSRT